MHALLTGNVFKEGGLTQSVRPPVDPHSQLLTMPSAVMLYRTANLPATGMHLFCTYKETLVGLPEQSREGKPPTFPIIGVVPAAFCARVRRLLVAMLEV